MKQFSKNDTNILKGLAIIFMLFYHCFMLEDRFVNYPMSIFPFDVKTFVWFARGGKYCVGIFVFLSAYGMACTFFKNSPKLDFDRKLAEKLTIRRILNLYSGFWFAYTFVFIVCWILPYVRQPYYFYVKEVNNIGESLIYLIMDVLGLGDVITGRTMSATWWYMGFAVGLIVLYPLLLKIYRVSGFFMVPLLGLVFAALELPVNNYTRFFLVVPLGIFCADKNLLAKIKDFHIIKNKSGNTIIKMVGITILMGLGMYDFMNNYSPLNYMTPVRDAIVIFLLILWGYLFLAEIPLINVSLAIVGKYSMNIFLIHSFIRASWLKDHIHSMPHYTIVVLVLLLESLAISIILELLKKYLGYNTCMKRFQQWILNKI